MFFLLLFGDCVVQWIERFSCWFDVDVGIDAGNFTYVM